MDKWQALNSFFNSFGVNAYDELVPDREVFPRITYQSSVGALDDVLQIDASVWDKSTSWATVDNIVNAIDDHLKNMGCPEIDGGRYRAYRGTPFAQRMADPENDDIRRTVLHINFEFMTD